MYPYEISTSLLSKIGKRKKKNQKIHDTRHVHRTYLCVTNRETRLYERQNQTNVGSKSGDMNGKKN